MSPRAACRLVSLGFESVYDYAAGKEDWTASGLPTEGEMAQMVRPGMIAVKDVPTCSLQERIEDVKARLRDGDMAIVTSEDNTVLGRVRGDALKDEAAVVADVMEPGPTTVRYDEMLPGLVERMQKGGVGSIVVTHPSGKLVGVMYRRAAEEVLEELHSHHEEHHHHD